jgi:hypothetical protein
MENKPLTEKQIKKIVQMEIKSCFEQLTNDVKEIKQALLGNEYQQGGLVAIVQSHQAYIERNKITNVAERSLRVVEWYEGLSDKKGTDGKSDLERLEDGIASIQAIGILQKWMVFFGISNIGTILALVLEMFIK